VDAPEDVLVESAARVGSDEPFFLVGGTGRGRGRGELVEPLPPLASRAVVLFLSPLNVAHKTARMFEALARQGQFDTGSVTARVSARLTATPIGPDDVYNAFERVAFDVFPGLASLHEQLETRIARPIHLAGAGPTLFWLGDPGARDAVVSVAAGLPCSVIATATAASLWKR
jgi:4-diphosphocytidyl-2-C-methyl-D-erythritol kinase